MKNNILIGIIIILGSELAVGMLLWLGLSIAGEAASAHLRWFGACFLAPLFLLRWLAKKQDYVTALKAAITSFFISFIAFMAVLLKTNSLSL